MPLPSLTCPPTIAIAESAPELGRTHARRLRSVYRSAGWPCQDMVEVELLAGQMLERVASAAGHETLRVTDAGIAWLAATLAVNRSALSAHEALVGFVGPSLDEPLALDALKHGGERCGGDQQDLAQVALRDAVVRANNAQASCLGGVSALVRHGAYKELPVQVHDALELSQNFRRQRVDPVEHRLTTVVFPVDHRDSFQCAIVTSTRQCGHSSTRIVRNRKVNTLRIVQ